MSEFFSLLKKFLEFAWFFQNRFFVQTLIN